MRDKPGTAKTVTSKSTKFSVFTAMNIQIVVCCVVMPCSVVPHRLLSYLTTYSMTKKKFHLDVCV
jgi:hypothetical protein